MSSGLCGLCGTVSALIARFMGPIWCPSGADRTQVGLMFAPWALLSGDFMGKPYNLCCFTSWWRHQMETFSALLAICAGSSPVPAEFPGQRPVTRSFDVFFDLRLNKRLSKQWWAGDLRRYRGYYDVIAMYPTLLNELAVDFITFGVLSKTKPEHMSADFGAAIVELVILTK